MSHAGIKCPHCVKKGLTSKSYPQGSVTTLLGFQPYYDEDGHYHVHDPNVTTTAFKCSRDHTWETKIKSACPCLGCHWNESKDKT